MENMPLQSYEHKYRHGDIQQFNESPLAAAYTQEIACRGDDGQPQCRSSKNAARQKQQAPLRASSSM